MSANFFSVWFQDVSNFFFFFKPNQRVFSKLLLALLESFTTKWRVANKFLKLWLSH